LLNELNDKEILILIDYSHNKELINPSELLNIDSHDENTIFERAYLDNLVSKKLLRIRYKKVMGREFQEPILPNGKSGISHYEITSLGNFLCNTIVSANSKCAT